MADTFSLTLDAESAEVLVLALRQRIRVVDRFDQKCRPEYRHLARMVEDVEAALHAPPVPEKLAGHISTGSGV